MDRVSTSTKGQSGLTLVELLVVLVVLSILAAAALPFAEVTIQRNKEYELKRALREIRTAIDEFHTDWVNGKISHTGDEASANGYPVSLDVLVQGVELAGGSSGRRYYLRRIPPDPFADQEIPPSKQWVQRGYTDASDSVISWGGEDVYDVYSASEQEALNGTMLKDW
jgi:general secretion pathway protein G